MLNPGELICLSDVEMINTALALPQFPVADPGFSPGGAPTPKVGVQTYFLGRKLHENERILTRGGRASLAPPLRSATGFVVLRIKFTIMTY